MKNYRKLFLCVIALWVIGAISINFIMGKQQKSTERPYLLEVYDIAQQMENQGVVSSEIDLLKYQYVKRIVSCEDEDALVESTPYEYVVRKVKGQLYRFEYSSDEGVGRNVVLLVNLIWFVCGLLILVMLCYIKVKIIDPFRRLEQVPYELAKGNLVMDLPETKTKYFGKFIWGTNMLKEHLEKQRDKELSMHKDKKMLLLSLTHDIKTPLSVIKLNAQALSRNLYKEEERRHEAVEEINAKVNEIEQYVSEIVEASREEFLDLEVKEEEFYLSSVIEHIREYYQGKMNLYKIDFYVDEYSDCLLCGDENRLKEVLENLIENAIKYGNGNPIHISFEREQGCCLVTVSNGGSTLAAEETVKVFDSFYRGSNVGTKKGNGLGLYICRKLMINMNGDIFVKQKEDVFAVTLVIRMA